MNLHRRINMIGPWLRRHFNERVSKIGLDLHLGCPLPEGRCIYCSPFAASQGLSALSLEQQLALGQSKPGKKLAYFQASCSTYAPASQLRPWFYQAAATPGISGLIISTRPDCLNDEHWRLLAELKDQGLLCWLELGLQSSHDSTLKLIKRGHSAACFAEAASRATGLKLPVVAHVILGLPGETPLHTNQTAEFLVTHNVWGVKLHSLMVLEDTELARWWRAGKYIPWDLDTWVRACAAFISLLPPWVTIHRLSANPGHGEICSAPTWAMHKNLALQALENFLEQQNIYQGCARSS